MRAVPIACFLLVASAGCAAFRAAGARADLTRALAEARASGAALCAPEELALAEAHLRFAALERDEGDLERSSQHLELADLNLRAAQRFVAYESCQQRRAIINPAASDHAPSPSPTTLGPRPPMRERADAVGGWPELLAISIARRG